MSPIHECAVALLNLPALTHISINGNESKILRRNEDLLVIKGVAPPRGFHLLVVRGGTDANTEYGSGVTQSSIGILIHYTGDEKAVSTLYDHGKNSFQTSESGMWFVARRYDASTEEMSSTPLDMISNENLMQVIYANDPIRPETGIILSHNDLCSKNYSRWHDSLTQHISSTVLQRHGLSGKGDKIIASVDTDTDTDTDSHIDSSLPSSSDGVQLSFPPMPCLDLNERVHTHKGTRSFLKQMNPSERTSLFTMYESQKSDGSIERDICVVFNRVLNSYYDGRWEVLFGEWQLSFVIFLCCGCLVSLEHWRDTLVMLSLVNFHTVDRYWDLYENLLKTLQTQVQSIDDGFLNDIGFSDEGNFFLVPTLSRLCDQCSKMHMRPKLLEKTESLVSILNERLNLAIRVSRSKPCAKSTTEAEEHDCDTVHVGMHDPHGDGPVVVSLEEVEASLKRSQIVEKK